MILNGKTIAQITEADLQLLVDEERLEDLRLDFKRDCYDFTDTDSKANKRKEFCKDVAALANASGGWIICGVADTQGKASQVLGIENLNVDTRKRQFVDWMDNDIEPKLYGVVMEPVSLATGNTILIIEVPRSFAGPHRTKTNEFPLRRDGKIDPNMGINDLRRAFVGNANYADQIRDFRRKRVEAILDFNHPDSFTPLEEGPLLIVHLLPLGMIENPQRVSFPAGFIHHALYKTESWEIAPWNGIPNLYGYLITRRRDVEKHLEYIQSFRSGALEYVLALPIPRDERTIKVQQCEAYILAGLAYCVRLLHSLNIRESCYVAITIARNTNYKWIAKDRLYDSLRTIIPLKHDPLYLPEQYVETWVNTVASEMRPIFNLLANALGLHSSANYDSQGMWIGLEPYIDIPSIHDV